MQPAWARSFEPPAVCPSATLHNVHSLIDLYTHTGNHLFLEPIPDALRWVRESKLPNGKWGRFLEISTNKPLYYDRDRIRVNSLEELSLERRTGYGYETDIFNLLQSAQHRFEAVRAIEGDKLGSQDTRAAFAADKNAGLAALAEKVAGVIASQDEHGRWIVAQDKFRAEVPTRKWNGEYRIEDRISSALFNENVSVLCEFLNLYQER
jgi:hypothetical protein